MTSGERPIEPDEWFVTPVAEVARFGRVIEMRSKGTEADAISNRQLLLESLPVATQELEQLHAQLMAVLSSVDARELLMQLAIPYLHVDANTWTESSSDQLPAHMQYLALQVLPLPEQELDDAERLIDPDHIQPALHETENLVRELFEIATRRLWIETMLSPETSLTEAERLARARMLSESITVRYKSYAHHTIHITTELLRPYGDQILEIVGFTLDEAFSIYESLSRLRFEPIDQRFSDAMSDHDALLKEAKRLRRGKAIRDSRNSELIRQLASLTPSQAKKQLRDIAVLWSFTDARRSTALTPERIAEVSNVEIGKVDAFLHFFTSEPSSFDERHHRFPCPTHPLQLRPLLRDGAAWLSPVPGDLLYALLPAIEDALHQDSRYWDSYIAWRGRFLEEESARLLRDALPGSKASTRLSWSAGNVSGELDALVEYGDSTLLVQCKAGRMPDAARRGGILSLHVSTGRLVGDAVKQHSSLRDVLERTSPKSLGLGAYEKALKAPLRLEVVVTLDDLSTFSTNAYSLREFGLLPNDEPVPWIVGLADLYVIRDLLKGTELIHYLTRRSKLNHLGRVSAHDELDWVGHYLSDGLFFDDLFGEPDAPDFFRLTSFTDAIDQWYFAQEGYRDVPTDRPSLVRPLLLSALIRRLEKEQPGQFVIAGCLLRDLGEEAAKALNRDLLLAQRRSAQRGSASVTMVLAPYAISIDYELVDPSRLIRRLQWFVRRDRPEPRRPLWLAIGQAPSIPLQIAIRGDPDLNEAVRTALMMPFANTGSRDATER